MLPQSGLLGPDQLAQDGLPLCQPLWETFRGAEFRGSIHCSRTTSQLPGERVRKECFSHFSWENGVRDRRQRSALCMWLCLAPSAFPSLPVAGFCSISGKQASQGARRERFSGAGKESPSGTWKDHVKKIESATRWRQTPTLYMSFHFKPERGSLIL